MKRAILLFFAVLAAATFPSQHCVAEESAISQRGNSATDLHFLNDIMATKSNDQRLYVLLGSGFLRPFSFGDPKTFVSKWLTANPNAVVTNISRMITTNTITHKQQEIVYIWIEDGERSLNVDLVRAGIFAGGTMFDMVDNQKGLDELLKTDPKLADARAQIEKERAAEPQDRTDRLVPEGDYKARMLRVEDAESDARAKKLGIWSEAMKDEREAEGVQ
jgi:hypothetical protein